MRGASGPGRGSGPALGGIATRQKKRRLRCQGRRFRDVELRRFELLTSANLLPDVLFIESNAFALPVLWWGKPKRQRGEALEVLWPEPAQSVHLRDKRDDGIHFVLGVPLRRAAAMTKRLQVHGDGIVALRRAAVAILDLNAVEATRPIENSVVAGFYDRDTRHASLLDGATVEGQTGEGAFRIRRHRNSSRLRATVEMGDNRPARYASEIPCPLLGQLRCRPLHLQHERSLLDGIDINPLRGVAAINEGEFSPIGGFGVRRIAVGIEVRTSAPKMFTDGIERRSRAADAYEANVVASRHWRRRR